MTAKQWMRSGCASASVEVVYPCRIAPGAPAHARQAALRRTWIVVLACVCTACSKPVVSGSGDLADPGALPAAVGGAWTCPRYPVEWWTPVLVPPGGDDREAVILVPECCPSSVTESPQVKALAMETGIPTADRPDVGWSQFFVVTGVTSTATEAPESTRYLAVAGLGSAFQDAGGGVLIAGPAGSGRQVWLGLEGVATPMMVGLAGDWDGDGISDALLAVETQWLGVLDVVGLGTTDGRTEVMASMLERRPFGPPVAAYMVPHAAGGSGVVAFLGLGDWHAGETMEVVVRAVGVPGGDERWSEDIGPEERVFSLSSVPSSPGGVGRALLVVGTTRGRDSLRLWVNDGGTGARVREWEMGMSGRDGVVLDAAAAGVSGSGAAVGVIFAVVARSVVGEDEGAGEVCIQGVSWEGSEPGWRRCSAFVLAAAVRVAAPVVVEDIDGDGVRDVVHVCLEAIAGTGGMAVCAASGATGEPIWRWLSESCAHVMS